MMEFLAANFNLPTIIVAAIMALPQARRRLWWVLR